MNLDEVRAHVQHWVRTCLSVPSPLFNDLPPCPYSREALLNGKVELRAADGPGFVETLREIGRSWDDRHVLVLVAGDRSLVNPAELSQAMSELNQAFERMDLIAFFDHPDCTDPKYKVTSSNGKYLLAGVQRLGAFVQAAKPLYKRKYFEKVNKQFASEKHLGKGGT